MRAAAQGPIGLRDRSFLRHDARAGDLGKVIAVVRDWTEHVVQTPGRELLSERKLLGWQRAGGPLSNSISRRKLTCLVTPPPGWLHQQMHLNPYPKELVQWNHV
jgi:hypothetical protein